MSMSLNSAFESIFDRLGQRFTLVHLVPNAFVVAVIWLLIVSGAPKTDPDLELIGDYIGDVPLTHLGLFLIAVLLAGFLLLPAQRMIIRLFEGYWADWAIISGFSNFLRGIQRRKYKQLLASTQFKDIAGKDLNGKMEKAHTAMWKLLVLFPDEDRIMPTSLGNILRSAEDYSYIMYGLDGVLFWPHLYSLLPKNLLAVIDDRRNQLDLTGRFTFSFLLMAIILAVMLICHWIWLLGSVILMLILAWFTYKMLLAAALAYGESIRVAYDLHRFDLYKDFRVELPRNSKKEREIATLLTDFFNRQTERPISFVHEKPKE